MAVPQQSNVGITSNPDDRPSNDPANYLTVPANANDLNRRNITMNVSGRRVVSYQRNKNPYAVDGGN